MSDIPVCPPNSCSRLPSRGTSLVGNAWSSLNRLGADDCPRTAVKSTSASASHGKRRWKRPEGRLNRTRRPSGAAGSCGSEAVRSACSCRSCTSWAASYSRRRASACSASAFRRRAASRALSVAREAARSASCAARMRLNAVTATHETNKAQLEMIITSPSIRRMEVEGQSSPHFKVDVDLFFDLRRRFHV